MIVEKFNKILSFMSIDIQIGEMYNEFIKKMEKERKKYEERHITFGGTGPDSKNV